jgi:hypothetical protein
MSSKRRISVLILTGALLFTAGCSRESGGDFHPTQPFETSTIAQVPGGELLMVGITTNVHSDVNMDDSISVSKLDSDSRGDYASIAYFLNGSRGNTRLYVNDRVHIEGWGYVEFFGHDGAFGWLMLVRDESPDPTATPLPTPIQSS